MTKDMNMLKEVADMDHKGIYVMMEINYLKENKRDIKDDNIDLFPNNWYLCQNYILKTNILYEAIKEHKKVEETEGYKLALEYFNHA